MRDPSQRVLGQRALVTGGTGFIGRNLVRHLVDAGCAVHMLLRPNSPGTDNPPANVHIHLYRGETSDVVEASRTSSFILLHSFSRSILPIKSFP
jgi:nucleoside-diphosphate-sugar epimerase